MNKYITILLLALFCAVNTSVDAQGNAHNVTARFLYVKKSPQTPSQLLLQGRRGIEELKISTRRPSASYKLPKNGRIIIGTPSEDDKNPITPLATGKAPAGASKLLVLLVPKKSGEYQMLILDERKFSGGSVCFLNQCGQPIGVILDGKKINVPVKATKFHRPFASSEPKNVHIAFHAGTKEHGKVKMKLFAETVWNISPGRGEICVFYRDHIRKKAAFKVLSSQFPT